MGGFAPQCGRSAVSVTVLSADISSTALSGKSSDKQFIGIDIAVASFRTAAMLTAKRRFDGRCVATVGGREGASRPQSEICMMDSKI